MYQKYGKVLENVSLRNYNKYGIGGLAKYIIFPSSIDNLINLLSDLKKDNIKYYVLGNGSNVILPDTDFDGAIVILNNLNKYIIDNNILTVESGMLLPVLNNTLINNGFVNFTWAVGIPGTIGGSVYGNAGAHGKEIFDNLVEITILENDEIKVVRKDNIEYSYRSTNINGIILSAKFQLIKGDVEMAKEEMTEILKKRQNSFPLDQKNCGSVFRNPEGDYAGRLIEAAGLKGYRIGDAMVSEKHANFIVNVGNATSKDIISLIDYVKKRIYELYNIDLILEQKIVKW